MYRYLHVCVGGNWTLANKVTATVYDTIVDWAVKQNVTSPSLPHTLSLTPSPSLSPSHPLTLQRLSPSTYPVLLQQSLETDVFSDIISILKEDSTR